MRRQPFVGAVAGSITAFITFVLIDYVFLGDPAMRNGDLHTPDPGFLLASLGLGAIAGAFIGGSIGAVRLNRIATGVIRGVLWAVAATVFVGLVSSSTYSPKLAEAHKVVWLFYGIPIGVVIGAITGAFLAATKSQGG